MERILFVDDEPSMLKAIQRALQGKFEVCLAGSGEEGLQCFINQGPFPVVVSDFQMPRMDGVAFLSQIRQMAPDTILIVEDEAVILKIAKGILEKLGYHVLGATSPEQAMELAKAHVGEIHLLIADVVMPEMNGRALAEKVQAFYPELRMLFMSGYTADVIADRGVMD
jgi:CheY-like chemotaxis protein